MNGDSSLSGWVVLAIVLFVLWSAVWKAFALYRAGANRSVAWFAVLFVINTAGVLEILYLFVFGRPRPIDAEAA